MISDRHTTNSQSFKKVTYPFNEFSKESTAALYLIHGREDRATEHVLVLAHVLVLVEVIQRSVSKSHFPDILVFAHIRKTE